MDGRQTRRAGVVTLFLAMVGTVGVCQIANTQQKPTLPDPSRPIGDTGRPDDPFTAKVAEQQARNRNSDRQKKLVADTDKLLSLATELKQQVDKTDKNTLSVDVVKKADEIEKLAHSVKEKMKGGA